MRLDIAQELLDRQLIDSEGARCGMVDEVELEGSPGATLRVRALLVGPRALARRLPALLRPLVRFPARTVRIPFEGISFSHGHVVLPRRAREYGLMALEERIGRYVRRMPGNEIDRSRGHEGA